MDGPDGLDGLGILGGGCKGIRTAALDGDALDLAGFWHPALHTGHIHPHTHAHRCQQCRQQHRAFPCAAENFQGFPQQHGHSEAAHQRHQHHAQQHSRQVGPDIIGTSQTEGHAVQDHAQRQTAHAAHAVAQHRPHPREGRHIAGELAAPPDTQHTGQCNDRHRNGGIDPQCLPAAVFQRAHISADDGIAHILSDDALRIRQPASQLHHRRTPHGKTTEVIGLIPVNEQLRQPVVPNKEVREVFLLQIRDWFDQVVANDHASTEKINRGFLEGKTDDIQRELTMFLGETISVLDTKARNEEKEIFYHGILIGILKNYSGWAVKSNRESGDGYADILLKPKNPDVGIVIELKYAHSMNELDKACERAMEQIKNHRYDAELREDGRNDLLAYGIAFCKKRCKVVVEKL